MLKMIDLFAGIGGIRIAFENNNVNCVMSSEIDKYACETYSINFGEIPLGDITKIDIDSIPEFDIIACGFPCQPFSIGGFRKGFDDTRGTLFFEIERIIKNRKPKAFLLENVAGLVSHDHGQTILVIENKLKSLGYNFKWELMNACNYGVPQNRNRWYCVGFRQDLNIGFDRSEENRAFTFNFPIKRELKIFLKDIIKENNDKQYSITETAQRNIQMYLPNFLMSKRYYGSEDIIIANEIRASRCNFRSDGISPCLTAKMGTGGNNVPVLVSQMRKLTENECLKIMGFPNQYKIKQNSSHSYKQIGNSVVVSLVSEIVREMVRVLKP